MAVGFSIPPDTVSRPGGSAEARACHVAPARVGGRSRFTVSTIGVAIIGSGGIALANHLPGFALCPDTKVVALCDSNPDV